MLLKWMMQKFAYEYPYIQVAMEFCNEDYLNPQWGIEWVSDWKGTSVNIIYW